MRSLGESLSVASPSAESRGVRWECGAKAPCANHNNSPPPTTKSWTQSKTVLMPRSIIRQLKLGEGENCIGSGFVKRIPSAANGFLEGPSASPEKTWMDSPFCVCLLSKIHSVLWANRYTLFGDAFPSKAAPSRSPNRPQTTQPDLRDEGLEQPRRDEELRHALCPVDECSWGVGMKGVTEEVNTPPPAVVS